MCGRYTLVRGDKIKTVFNVTVAADLRLVGRYNIAPSQLAPVITNQSAQLQLFKWGLIPSWAKDPKIAFKMINARAETLAEKPAFRAALKRRRCVIPADGFYEWRADSAGKKTPVYIQRTDEEIFAFAGLWDTWHEPQGGEVSTFAIITTTANALIRPIHDRMPVILPQEGVTAWLTAGELTAPEAVAWLKPYPAEAMKLHAVSPLVNSARNEGSELVAPVSERAAPQEEVPPGLFG